MSTKQEWIQRLLQETEKLHARHKLSKTVTADYFEPGRMEYLAQSDGTYDPDSGVILLRFEAKGTRYEGRTEQIEKVRPGDPLQVVRENTNRFNPNNFTLLTAKGKNVGNMPAELCNAIAPLYDCGTLRIANAQVSFVEPISKRSRHAKQAILFAECSIELLDAED